jgi:hypothetical protein
MACRLTGRPPSRRSYGVEPLGFLLVVADKSLLASVQEAGSTLLYCDTINVKLVRDKALQEGSDRRRKGRKVLCAGNITTASERYTLQGLGSRV